MFFSIKYYNKFNIKVIPFKYKFLKVGIFWYSSANKVLFYFLFFKKKNIASSISIEKRLRSY